MQDPAPDHDLSDVYDNEMLALIDGWTSSEHESESGTAPTLPSRLSKWSRNSLAGAAMTGIGLALREVYDPPPDEQIVVEVDDAGEPHDPTIQLFLDPDDPAGSICILRPDQPV